MEVLKKSRIELSLNIAVPLLGIYLKNMKILIKKDICTSMFIAELFIIAKTWKQLKRPLMDEWIKLCCVHTRTRILLRHKKMKYCPM